MNAQGVTVSSGRLRRACVLVLTFSAFMFLCGCRSYGAWVLAKNWLAPTPYYRVVEKPKPATWPEDHVTVTWIGHATVLINFHGTTILNDPVLGKRVGLHLFGHTNLGIRRISEAALAADELPPIDIVLLSHAHNDHWDIASLKHFDARTAAIIPVNDGDLIPRGTFGRVVELGWGQSEHLDELTVEAFPVNHWGARPTAHRPGRGYNGYVISGHGRRIVFVGDSGWMPDFSERLPDGPVDLCILPIGSYDPWIRNHASPEQAWSMFRQSRADRLLATHWYTFILSVEPPLEPMVRLLAAAGDQAGRIVCRAPCEVYVLPLPVPCPAPSRAAGDN